MSLGGGPLTVITRKYDAIIDICLSKQRQLLYILNGEGRQRSSCMLLLRSGCLHKRLVVLLQKSSALHMELLMRARTSLSLCSSHGIARSITRLWSLAEILRYALLNLN
jgi:hypothetical protein